MRVMVIAAYRLNSFPRASKTGIAREVHLTGEVRWIGVVNIRIRSLFGPRGPRRFRCQYAKSSWY